MRGAADALQTLRATAALLDHSLVTASTDDSEEAEFEMHPLVREFAAELMEREGEQEAAYLLLTEYCLALANAPARSRAVERSCNSTAFESRIGSFRYCIGVAKERGAFVVGPFLNACGRSKLDSPRGGRAWLRMDYCSIRRSRGRVLDDALLAEAHWVASSLAKASDRWPERTSIS